MYLIWPGGQPCALAWLRGNEFSDHRFEKRNYLYLAGSKTRTARSGRSWSSIRISIRAGHGGDRTRRRDSSGRRHFATAKPNVPQPCEHRASSFQVRSHRRPGDVHVHFFGACCLSFGDGDQVRRRRRDAGSFEGFGRPLSQSGARVQIGGRAHRSQFAGIRGNVKTTCRILGLGIMGGGMARRLLSMGFPVSVYNRTREKAEKLATSGALCREYTARSCRQERKS